MRLQTIKELFEAIGRPRKPSGFYKVDLEDRDLSKLVKRLPKFLEIRSTNDEHKVIIITQEKSKELEKVLTELKFKFEILNQLNESVITPPDIPHTMNFWHGGNLDEYDDVIAQKNGKYEYGPGLYITTHYDTARKYSKGSRKFYLVTVENGNDIADSTLPLEDVNEFIDKWVTGAKKKTLKEDIKKYDKGGKIKAYLLNNMILNDKAIKSTNTPELRKFFVEHDIDYEIVDNAFGWGEKMMVLYNMKKIKQVIQIKPGDKIEEFDLLKHG